jgi:hypothetical protein
MMRDTQMIYPHPHGRRFPAPGAGVRFKSEEGPPGKRRGPGHRSAEAPKNVDPLAGKIDSTHTKAEHDLQYLEERFLELHAELVRLRREGKSLQELAEALGVSRLEIHRRLQKAPSTKLKLQLGIPTGGGLQ